MSPARLPSLLAAVDADLVELEACAFPPPHLVKRLVRSTRNLLAALVAIEGDRREPDPDPQQDH